MSIDRINLGPATPVGGASAASPSALGEAGARSIAQAVVGRIASELSLGGAPAAGDGYNIRALADAVASQLGAGPAEAGELTRALEGFAGAVAADMAAFADGRTLDRVDAALAEFAPGPGAQGAGAVTQFLEQAAASIDAAR